ncbi:MAG: hypothetical protein P4L75_02455 [Clostridia bacterium]|nr:hypothetical protein [Clostridia bacterium]MDR3645822.1 hypothetical protein [Clostridia bacterium]
MFDTMHFIVRSSGRHEGKCYIDYRGLYKIADISAEAKIGVPLLTEIYEQNGGTFDASMEVYYFESSEAANAVVAQVLQKMKAASKGRTILLTEQEISCIRRALIGDGATLIGINAKLKDSILKKLNG